ncbi:hypothetical protein BpHYR1_017199 [Brachionus plicatilis]|uniref:Uncharacterized protein n=1 Tax=Brachionus plicatilis TaxID=10195 RepID=A0A3M7PKY2_BRAPC|nr:hypothetical protein BpHYR1_017199 [Brachionus plicatilis]
MAFVYLYLRSKYIYICTQTVNTNRQKPTNRNPLRELNLQTDQTKSPISIASNIETCSNQLKQNNVVEKGYLVKKMFYF